MSTPPFDPRARLRFGDDLVREHRYAEAISVYQTVASYYLDQVSPSEPSPWRGKPSTSPTSIRTRSSPLPGLPCSCSWTAIARSVSKARRTASQRGCVSSSSCGAAARAQTAFDGLVRRDALAVGRTVLARQIEALLVSVGPPRNRDAGRRGSALGPNASSDYATSEHHPE